MKRYISAVIRVLIAITITAIIFYSYRAIQYWGTETKGKITDCVFFEEEYEGRNRVVVRKELGIAYSFQTPKGDIYTGKRALAFEAAHALIEEYYLPEIEENEDFYSVVYQNPTYYLVGKPLKIRYVEHRPQNNTLSLLYEEDSPFADLAVFAFIFGIALLFVFWNRLK